MLPEFNQMVEAISTLPGIGKKSAMRIAFHFLKQPQTYINTFQNTLNDFVEHISYCQECGSLKSVSMECKFCDTHQRNQEYICIVEEPSDLFIIEKSGEFKGLYHILMGVLSPLDGITPDDIRLKELVQRIKKKPTIKEVIIATNPTIEGNATAHYISSILKEDHPQIKFTRIASGLAIGTRLEYTDTQVISESIKNRNPLLVE